MPEFLEQYVMKLVLSIVPPINYKGVGEVLVIAFLATQRLVDWTLEWMSHEVLQKGDDFHLWGPQNRELH